MKDIEKIASALSSKTRVKIARSLTKRSMTSIEVYTTTFEVDSEYQKFYQQLRDSTHLWSYGDGNRKDDTISPYGGLLRKLLNIKQLLELGFIPDCSAIADRYNQEIPSEHIDFA